MENHRQPNPGSTIAAPARAVAPPRPRDEIDWRRVFEVLRDHLKLIVLIVVLTTALAGLYAWITPNTYRADIVICPLDHRSSTGAGANLLSAQVGGLAGLAGVSLGSDSEKAVAVATLGSRLLIEGLIRDENLLPILFSKRWDAQAKAWKKSSAKDPTLLDGYTLFRKRLLKIDEDKKTTLVTIVVTWKSPEQAAHWANELVRRANEQLRQRALDESDHNLTYLEEQVQHTSVVALQQSIYSLMEDQLKKAMVAKGDDQYSFRVVDPAVVPEKKIWPQTLLILVLGFVGGCVLGVGGVLLLRGQARG